MSTSKQRIDGFQDRIDTDQEKQLHIKLWNTICLMEAI